MLCPRCGRPAKLLASEQVEEGIIRLTRMCTIPVDRVHKDHIFTTFEVLETYWVTARHDIQKKLNGKAYNDKIKSRAELAEQLKAERRKGVTCGQLHQKYGAKYGLSFAMIQYYARLPRHELYHVANRPGQAGEI